MDRTLKLIPIPAAARKKEIVLNHEPELYLLDWKLFVTPLPVRDYGVKEGIFQIVGTIQEPRENRYVLNLRSFHIDGKVVLSTNYTNYRSLVALKKVLPKLGPKDSRYQKIIDNIKPLGTVVLFETKDGNLVIEKRAENVEMPGMMQPAPGGTCDTSDPVDLPHPLQVIKREILEEGGVKEEHFKDLQLLGLSYDFFHTFNPNLAFYAKSDLTFKQLVKASSIASGASEKNKFIPLEIDERIIQHHLLANHNKYVTHGLGSILIFGSIRFGKKWFDETVELLEKKGWKIEKKKNIGEP